MSNRAYRSQRPKSYSISAAIAVRRSVRLPQHELAEFANHCGRTLGDNGREIGLGSTALTLLEERSFKRCRKGKPLSRERVMGIAATLEEELRVAGFTNDTDLDVRVDPARPLDVFGNGTKLAIPVICSPALEASRDIIQQVIKEETGRFIEYGAKEFDPHISIAEINNSDEVERIVSDLALHWRNPTTIALNGIEIYRNWQG